MEVFSGVLCFSAIRLREKIGWWWPSGLNTNWFAIILDNQLFSPNNCGRHKRKIKNIEFTSSSSQNSLQTLMMSEVCSDDYNWSMYTPLWSPTHWVNGQEGQSIWLKQRKSTSSRTLPKIPSLQIIFSKLVGWREITMSTPLWSEKKKLGKGKVIIKDGRFHFNFIELLGLRLTFGDDGDWNKLQQQIQCHIQ